MKTRFRTLLGLTLATTPWLAPLARAEPKTEVDVVVDMTPEGRKVVHPSPGHPAYYLPIVGGYREEGNLVAGEKPPPPPDVVHLIAVELAKQDYLVMNLAPGAHGPRPSLILVVFWGYLNPEIEDFGQPGDASQSVFFNQNQMLALVGGNTLNNLDLDFEREEVMQGAEQDRYFISISAYDFAAYAQTRRKVLLWQAKMSVPSGRVDFAQVLAPLVQVGGPWFGRETTRPKMIMAPITPAGRVEIGPLKVTDYVDAPAAPALRLPDPPPDGLPRGQAFDYQITDQEKSSYAGSVYFIWGARSPLQPPGVVASKYLPYARDPDRAHTLAWYGQNHPDWIVYQADRTTPAWGFTYSGGNCMPLDISNPAVREFYFNTYVLPAVKAGFPVIAFDNAGLTNWDHRSGHYDHGRWVETFDGEKVDAKYAAAVVDWLEYLRGRLHPMGVGIAANIKCYNEPVLMPGALEQEVEAVDIFCDEGGFTFHRDGELADQLWEAKVAFLQRVLPHVRYFSLNSMTGPRPPHGGEEDHDVESKNYRSTLAGASRQQVEYAIASFLLVRERGSMLGLIGQEEHGSRTDRPELHVDLGAPMAPPARLPSGAWERRYQRGLVFVNPSSSVHAVVSLPPGAWQTLAGGTVAQTLDLAPITGAVLIGPPRQ